MSTSSLATKTPTARNVKVGAHTLIVELRDGRTVSVPVSWYPRLAEGTPSERRRWELIGPGIGIHWPALDEDISVEALLLGLASNESTDSLQRWRAARRRPAHKRMASPRSGSKKRAAHS
jgi:uncharacterized protein DUF2442